MVFMALVVYAPSLADLAGDLTGEVHQSPSEALALTPEAPAVANSEDRQESLKPKESRYAYATLLAGDSQHTDPNEASDHDNYFVATRLLAYQLLHAPETRTTNNIPFIVLVTPTVAEDKRERLRLDGAVVWEAPPMDPGWVHTDIAAWGDVLSKLRLWHLTQFDRIAFFDADTVLVAPVDGVFNDTAVVTRITQEREGATMADEASLPPEYVFASIYEMAKDHQTPPDRDGIDYPNVDYLNVGFFVMQPSLAALEYYLSLLALPSRFNPTFPEQNLLNYAHRREGNMPWTRTELKWNVHYPTLGDLEGGVASLHEKWWDPTHPELAPFLESRKRDMEEFFSKRERVVRRRMRFERQWQ